MTSRNGLFCFGMLAFTGCSSLWSGIDKNCEQNADCPSGLCLDLPLGDYAAGTCVPSDTVRYVDWDRCGGGAKTGQQDNPFCEVQDAIVDLPSDTQLHIIQVKASTRPYQGIKINHQHVALFGPWADPRLKGTRWDQSPAATLVAKNTTYYAGLLVPVEGSNQVEAIVDGLAVTANTSSFTECSTQCLALNVEPQNGSAALTLRRSVVSGSTGNGISVFSGKFTLIMDRCKVTNNKGIGLGLSSNNVMYTVTNSVFANNGDAGVVLDGMGAGIFDSNTVIHNGTPNNGGGILCNGPRSVSNSIVFENTNGNSSQFTSTCQLHNTIVGKDSKSESDGIGCSPPLTADWQLTPQSTCAIDRAQDNPNLPLDYFGTPRPQGGHSDIGFHELVMP